MKEEDITIDKSKTTRGDGEEREVFIHTMQ